LKREFGLDGSKFEKLLDFGCGQGASCLFFKSKGFNVYGVDVSSVNIDICRKRMPDITDHFMVVEAMPHTDDIFFGGDFDLVIAIDSLYYYNNTNLRTRLTSLNNQMRQDACIYATMIGTKSAMYYNSVPYEDGLVKVILNDRISKESSVHYINLTESEKDVAWKFSMFKKRHIGFYTYKYREDEEMAFFYTFVGQRNKV
jgi:cyclopropane fatty-acyl-phospholipid synthase-like methyltransferase